VTAESHPPASPAKRPRVAVMGAGAVGCYYGGMLARAGHEVVLIGRPAHVEAIEAQGLTLETRTFTQQVRLDASTSPAAVQGADWVLVCVKSIDTEAAAMAMAPHMAPGATFFSLQNGVDNAERLALGLGRAVVPAVVYVASEMAGPGHVRHHGRGELWLGPHPGSDVTAMHFGAAGVPARIVDDVAAALWSKLVVNCAYNALSAISGLSYGPLLQGQGVERVIADVVDECLAVARAEGIRFTEDPREAVAQIPRTMPTQRSSTAQDLANGRRTEIDHLNGHVVRRGMEMGIPTPANRVLHTLVRLLEQPRQHGQ
jgi:2-dehydropantoate 2-reductase